MTPLLLDAIAVYRLTRLATADTLTQPLREKVIAWSYQQRLGAETAEASRALAEEDGRPDYWQRTVEIDRQADDPVPKLADLITCRWCASVWLALFAVAARRLAPRLWDPLARALALSAAAALLAGLEE